MVAGGEHCQLRAAIEVLVPYTFLYARRAVEAVVCFYEEMSPSLAELASKGDAL
jgi:hypothetical protein